MRAAPLAILAILAVFVMSNLPAYAGEVTVMGGQVTWRSTKCVAPTIPPSLVAADRHTPANDMNVMVTQYNDYAKKMQGYMNCLSDEAKEDADLVSQAVINSASGAIDETQKSVDKLGAEVKQ